jgi:RNAse (barnase) inhibitor barstar
MTKESKMSSQVRSIKTAELYITDLQKGIKLFYLNGEKITNKTEFLAQIAEVMAFPDYFGHNWDALDECLTDLSWLSAEGYIIVYYQPHFFAQSEPQQWEIAHSILNSATKYWQQHNIPMDILLIS